METRIGAETVPSSLTTPEAPDLQALFAVMAERGVTAAAMEVSSHSLALGRVAGTSFDVAVFTNLSQDHLDFHADMEDYFRAKASLFMPPRGRGGEHRRQVRPPARVLRAACRSPRSRPPGRAEADWRAADVRSGADGSTFRVIGPGGVEADVSVGLAGAFNVANALGAVVALVEAGIRLEDAVAGRRRLPGRPRPAGAGARGRARPDRVRRLLAQAGRGRGRAALAARRSPGEPDHRARLRRRPGHGQAPDDGRRGRVAGRRGHFHQ